MESEFGIAKAKAYSETGAETNALIDVDTDAETHTETAGEGDGRQGGEYKGGGGGEGGQGDGGEHGDGRQWRPQTRIRWTRSTAVSVTVRRSRVCCEYPMRSSLWVTFHLAIVTRQPHTASVVQQPL